MCSLKFFPKDIQIFHNFHHMVNFGHVSELLKKNRARCYQVVCSDINQYRRKKRGFKRKNKGLYGKLGKWNTPQKSRCRDDENIENKTVAYILVLKKNEQYFFRALHKFPFLENVSSIKPFWKITRVVLNLRPVLN